MGSKNKTRFSYIEILFISIMLGAVAISISPEFTHADGYTNDHAKVTKLIKALEKTRAQLDLYQICNKEESVSAVELFSSFNTKITSRTGQFGRKINKIPCNPFNNLDSVRINGEAAGADTHGWRYDTKTGLFQADNNVDCAAL